MEKSSPSKTQEKVRSSILQSLNGPLGARSVSPNPEAKAVKVKRIELSLSPQNYQTPVRVKKAPTPKSNQDLSISFAIIKPGTSKLPPRVPKPQVKSLPRLSPFRTMKAATQLLRIRKPIQRRSDSLNFSLYKKDKRDLHDLLTNSDEEATAMRLNTSEGIWDLLQKKVRFYNQNLLSLQRDFDVDENAHLEKMKESSTFLIDPLFRNVDCN